LSGSVHNSLLRTSSGVIVLPQNLVNEETTTKMVRYLIANGEDVAILGKGHLLRLPKDRERNNPSKKEKKRRRREIATVVVHSVENISDNKCTINPCSCGRFISCF
jgi:hypothetical protein